MGKLIYPYGENKKELMDFARLLRDRGERIIMTGGTFDVERLTPIHIAYLRDCKSLGDALVVNVTNDRRARLRKNGEKSSIVPRPFYTEEVRALYVSALDSTNCVTVHPYVGNPDDPEDIGPTGRLAKLVRPDVLVKGIQSKDDGGWGSGEKRRLEEFLGYKPKFKSIRIEDNTISSTTIFDYRAAVNRGLEVQESNSGLLQARGAN
ncbi:MAG: hypothetical protein KKB79_02250 [Nanoarchaeota archaeon]|nr:hypothetical protein [Nanoarchaeota archaeon]